jgi:acetyl-CoA C-acetyltransferase
MDLNDRSVADDEQPGRARIDKIPTLRPAFKKDGTITAANSSSISDGSSALVLSRTDSSASLARIVAHATFSRHPSEFTIAPVGAIGRLLERAGWRAEDVDLWEINEAFAMVTMLAMNELHLDPERVNLYGGACAQGHPIGSTGSRLIVTLAHAMAKRQLKRGVAALCIGGGEATAVALERD